MHVWNNQAPTAMLMGRFQPWHDGHQALFEQALARTGQVCILVRDTQNMDDKNPFDFEFVKQRIQERLEPAYAGRYQIMLMPNITHVCYGRDVGYKIEQVHLPPETEAISATQVRAQMAQQGELP
jgi:nicotinamide mononucleotide adenylyltransferase